MGGPLAASAQNPGPLPFTAADLRDLPPAAREALIASLTPEESERLKYLWEFWARPDQLEPAGNWLIWLVLAGRGFGKTRTGVESTRGRADSGKSRRIALVGSTADDARAVLVEGESGILACSSPWNRPKFEPSKRRLTWPNGVQGFVYSADEPDRLRGPQHDFALLDELAAWKYAEATFDMLMFGLRLGSNPQCVITTTPRPISILKDLVKRSDPRQVPVPDVVVTRGSTLENKANLPPIFLNQILSKYAGTRLGRQEIEAVLLDDVPGALWNDAILEGSRVQPLGHYPDGLVILPGEVQIYRTVIGVDPAGRIADMARIAAGLPLLGGQSSTGDECGIVVAGRGDDDEGYVLADRSAEGSPEVWGNAVVDAYLHFGADAVAVEYNHGGETAEEVILACARNRGINHVHVIRVWASKGKYTRAEPISALYEQSRCHHVGQFDKLEDEMTTFVPGRPSPNRLDAAVIALTELMIGPGTSGAPAVGGPRGRVESPFG